MQQKNLFLIIIFLFATACSTPRGRKETKIAEERPSVKCMENSPERYGEEGCTILANRPLLGSPANAYWHIDRFDSLEAAIKAAGANGVAAEAHGSFWLMTVEGQNLEDHHGGRHVCWNGPLVLPAAERLIMRIQSSLLKPGSTTPVHTHSGPEAFYMVDGEQCIETTGRGQHLGKGQTYIVMAGVVHRGRVIGSAARRALALVLYDAKYAASYDIDRPPPLVLCK